MTNQPVGHPPQQAATADAVATVTIGGAALAAAALIPADSAESGPVLCPFRLLTGIECPACGLTRSWIYLAHGDVGASLASHLVGPAVVLFTLVSVVVAAVALMTRRWVIAPRTLVRVLVVLCAAIVAFGVWRWMGLLLA